MDIGKRIERYVAIEKYRKRPLIVYATSTRPGVPAMMAGDTVREFIDQLDTIQEGDAVDVLIHSSGGDPLAAWKLMSVLRERFKRVAVLVPFAAFSAATIFALGADEIVMHPHARHSVRSTRRSPPRCLTERRDNLPTKTSSPSWAFS